MWDLVKACTHKNNKIKDKNWEITDQKLNNYVFAYKVPLLKYFFSNCVMDSYDNIVLCIHRYIYNEEEVYCLLNF